MKTLTAAQTGLTAAQTKTVNDMCALFDKLRKGEIEFATFVVRAKKFTFDDKPITQEFLVGLGGRSGLFNVEKAKADRKDGKTNKNRKDWQAFKTRVNRAWDGGGSSSTGNSSADTPEKLAASVGRRMAKFTAAQRAKARKLIGIA